MISYSEGRRRQTLTPIPVASDMNMTNSVPGSSANQPLIRPEHPSTPRPSQQHDSHWTVRFHRPYQIPLYCSISTPALPPERLYVPGQSLPAYQVSSADSVCVFESASMRASGDHNNVA